MIPIDSKHPEVIRLYNEWTTHGKIILAVDFDDTISVWKHATQEQCDRVIEKLKEAQQVGTYVMIFTACKTDRYDHIREYCKSKELHIDTINEAPVPNLPYGSNVKPYYNHLLDDRAALEAALEILMMAMYMVRSDRTSERLDYPGSLGF
jgi:hypothetical protein